MAIYQRGRQGQDEFCSLSWGWVGEGEWQEWSVGTFWTQTHCLLGQQNEIFFFSLREERQEGCLASGYPEELWWVGLDLSAQQREELALWLLRILQPVEWNLKSLNVRASRPWESTSHLQPPLPIPLHTLLIRNWAGRLRDLWGTQDLSLSWQLGLTQFLGTFFSQARNYFLALLPSL